jgi:hypothetical protein
VEAINNSIVSQPPLGILMLDTAFSRPLGDAGNPASWPFPVVIERVNGAYARPVVEGTLSDVTTFIEAGRRLCDKGACAIITTCGFLVRHQEALAKALPVPVLTSTLTQHERIKRALPTRKHLAILTICATSLDAATLDQAGIESDALVFDLPKESHFVRVILDGYPSLDVELATREWVALARICQQHYPDIGGWLFECANMPPYSKAVAAATGLDVYDAITLGKELRARSLHTGREAV